MDTAAKTAELIVVTHKNGIATIKLNRPDVLNAVNDQMRAELIDAFSEMDRDPSVRAVILTGAGKGFCSGGDIVGMRARLDAPAGDIAFNGWKRQQSTHKAVSAIHRVSKPVIAAVNGAAFGLGLDMALACDFIIAAEGTKLSMSFLKRGLVSDGGGMYFLPRRVGLTRAKELIFSARVVDAAEALAIGLVDRVVGAGELIERAQCWADELSFGSPTAIALSKEILDKSLEGSDEEIFAMGRKAQAICYTTTEHRQAVEDFLNKISK